jgi:hypothetical protein
MIIAAVIFVTLQGTSVAADEVGPISRIPPQYPAAGAQFGITASCPVVFDIGDGGVPHNICVTCYTSAPDYLPASTHEFISGEFANASQLAISQWRYPAQHAGRSRIHTNLEFMLSNDDGSMVEPPEPGPNTNCRQPETS